MPHLIIEYSDNIESVLALDDLMLKLRDCAVASGVFPLAGVRVRGARRDRYLVADGDPENAFIHLVARIGHGRDLQTRQAVSKDLFATLCDHVEALFERRGLGLTFEMVEIEPATSFKKNNLHERLES